MTQLSLEDAMEGEQRKADGMAAVLDHADSLWTDRAWAYILFLGKTGQEFTSETVRAVVGDPPGSGNVFGALFSKAARGGSIRSVGWTKATRPGLHATDLRVWVGAPLAAAPRASHQGAWLGGPLDNARPQGGSEHLTRSA